MYTGRLNLLNVTIVYWHARLVPGDVAICPCTCPCTWLCTCLYTGECNGVSACEYNVACAKYKVTCCLERADVGAMAELGLCIRTEELA